MTDKQQGNEEQSELESPGVLPAHSFWRFDWMCAFLMKAPPALLLVWSAVAVVLAGLFTFLGFRSATSPLIIESFQGGTSNGGGVFAASIFAIPAFLLGIVGTLLPMWAVGRLIADAIKDGAKS